MVTKRQMFPRWNNRLAPPSETSGQVVPGLSASSQCHRRLPSRGGCRGAPLCRRRGRLLPPQRAPSVPSPPLTSSCCSSPNRRLPPTRRFIGNYPSPHDAKSLSAFWVDLFGRTVWMGLKSDRMNAGRGDGDTKKQEISQCSVAGSALVLGSRRLQVAQGKALCRPLRSSISWWISDGNLFYRFNTTATSMLQQLQPTGRLGLGLSVSAEMSFALGRSPGSRFSDLMQVFAEITKAENWRENGGCRMHH